MADPEYPIGSGAGMARERERSAAEVMKDIVANMQDIVRSEVRLAKVEIKEETKKASFAGAMIGAGAVIGLYALGFALLAWRDAMNLALPAWASCLIIAFVVGGAAAVLLALGRARIKQVSKPEQTIQSVKENVEWARNRMH